MWSEAPDIVVQRLLTAADQSQREKVDAEQLRKYLELLTPVIRARLGITRAGRWLSPEPSPVARNVAKRLGALIHEAARLRQDRRLLQLERALAFVAGGHTAGEEMLIDRVAGGPDGDMLSVLERMTPQTAWEGLEVRLTGLILFAEPDSLSSAKNGEYQ
jgi:hypothetical protein